MLSKFIRFPNIDYNYWCNKNDYFNDTPLIPTIRTGLVHARKGGLIDKFIDENSINTNKDLVDLIALKIKGHNDNINNFSDEELLLIFDLIQAWGGKMGRGPYVKPKINPSRNTLDPEIYRSAINFCTTGNYAGSLKKLKQIQNVAESFATKHIFFWSEYGPSNKALPIYDNRIKTLLFLKKTAALPYEDFVTALNSKSIELQLSPVLIERALFSFSENFFPNSTLIIKESISDSKDIDEARWLQSSANLTLNK